LTAPARREGGRRLLHALSGALGVAAAVAPPRLTTIGLTALVALALTLETARLTSPAARALLTRAAGGWFRPPEARAISAATLLAAAYLITWLLFAPAFAARAITVTALADPAAALIGTRFAPRSDRPRKSWVGSAAAFATALLVLLAWRTPPAAAALAAAAAAAAERLPGAGVDNVAVPLAAAAVLRLAA